MEMTDASEWSQCGRTFSTREIEDIRKTVQWLPGVARKELAATICEHLEWHTPSGTPKLQACQKLLEKMKEQGLIDLPALRQPKNPGGDRARVAPGKRTANENPVVGSLRDIGPVRLELARETSDVGLWNEYVERFHPHGYKGAFGYRLRYFVRNDSQSLGCVLLAGAARAIAMRDDWIGWDSPTQLTNLPRIVNNSRFLILPHVRIPHLASHVLGQLVRRVRADSERHWGFAPLLMDTFVDPSRFRGTCYRAAGWKLLGQTSGRGLARPGKSYRSTPRLVLIKPLHRGCRSLLCDQSRPAILER